MVLCLCPRPTRDTAHTRVSYLLGPLLAGTASQTVLLLTTLAVCGEPWAGVLCRRRLPEFGAVVMALLLLWGETAETAPRVHAVHVVPPRVSAPVTWLTRLCRPSWRKARPPRPASRPLWRGSVCLAHTGEGSAPAPQAGFCRNDLSLCTGHLSLLSCSCAYSSSIDETLNPQTA